MSSTVFTSARVINPETNFDDVRDVIIVAGKIANIYGPFKRNVDGSLAQAEDDPEGMESGAVCIDASGLVLAPGFIDLHAHGQNVESATLQMQDGVTTALELEVGVHPVAPFYDAREAQGWPINFGCSAGHIPARIAVLEGIEVGHALTVEGCEKLTFEAGSHSIVATDEQVVDIVRTMEDGLTGGAVGYGLGIEYTQGADHREVYRIMESAGKKGVACFIHLRAGARAPGS